MSEPMARYSVQVVLPGHHRGTLICDDVNAVVEEISTHLADDLHCLEPLDEPINVTIGRITGEPATITISRTLMTDEELDALPEHEGW